MPFIIFLLFFGLLFVYVITPKARYINVKIIRPTYIDPDIENDIHAAKIDFGQTVEVYFSDAEGHASKWTYLNIFKQRYITFIDTSNAHYNSAVGWGLSGGWWSGIRYFTFKYDKKIFLRVKR